MMSPGRTWSHTPSSQRDEKTVYQLPKNEVLPWLMNQTEFLQATSSEANDQCRAVIHDEQYPRLHGETCPIHSPANWSADTVAREIDAFVINYGARELESRHVMIGYTPVLREHVYSDGVVRLPNAVVLGLPMRYEQTNAAPEPIAGEEVTRNYMELGGLTLALGMFLRACGYSAEVHHPRGDENAECEAMFIPHAVAAGMGDLGRHGSMISRDFGPRVRLSMVTTDAPVPMHPKREAGIAEFCTWCTKCMDACPVDAIAEHRTEVRGSYRHIVDTSACLPYFAQTDGCGICIAVCPYNRPDESQSREFFDAVVEIDWVKEAMALRSRDGAKAMEQFVKRRKSARDL